MIKIAIIKIKSLIFPCTVQIGDFVMWESLGVVQWEQTRRVVFVERFSGEWFAFVDGSMTAIKVSELIKESI